MTEKSLFSAHGIKDNHTRGKVADFLETRLVKGSRLSVVSAYFTIYAYEALRNLLPRRPARPEHPPVRRLRRRRYPL